MIRLVHKKHLARQFARAFFKKFTLPQKKLFDSLDALAEVLKSNPLAFHTLELSSARLEEKCLGIDRIAKKIKLPAPLSTLLHAVVRHKALSILPFLLPALKEVYKKNNEIHDVTVASPKPLLAKEKKELEAALTNKLPGTLSFQYEQDESLGAGIKVSTPTHFWEHSLAKILKTVRQQIQEQETI